MLVKRRRVGRSFWGDLGAYVFLFAFALLMVIPILFVVGNAFKPLDEIWLFPPRVFPLNPTLKNFKDMFS